MQTQSNAIEKALVLSYINALDKQDYDSAMNYLNDEIRIRGNSNESFNRPREFIEMLRQFRGKYNVKKVFADGEDVCLIYDLVTPVATVIMCSWYQVKNGKIASIQTVFDPSAFAAAPSTRQ
ncbi:MAG: nuclear transport factor 2 family protein [Thaumarchaeota archaeon]|nr:nuclear transport factor 2 family protein [Nitrososphaerota archaeon]